MTTTTPQAALLSAQEIEEMALQEQFLLVCDGLDELTCIVRAVEVAILAKLQSTQAPVQAGELPDERAAFEQWASDNGEFPRAVARSGDVYHLMATQTYWLAWQARAALSARKPLTDEAASDEVIELSAALERRRILEGIKTVAKIHLEDDMPTPFQSAWSGCCEEIFYMATENQWHMDEDAERFNGIGLEVKP